MNRVDLELQQIEKLKGDITQVKNTISNLRARRAALSSQPVFTQGEGLAQSLGTFLPKHIRPLNVGNLNTVAWQFQYAVNFNLTETQPWIDSVASVGVGAITNQTQQSKIFQVTQEAAFLMMSVMRHANDYDDGDLAPLTFQFRDLQSSRFFNNEPTPIQMFGQKGFMSYVPTPMLLMPNARFEISMGCNLDQGVTQLMDVGATGIHRCTMVGYSVRVEDAGKVLSSIFG